MKLIEADKVEQAIKDYWKAQVDKALTLTDGNEKRINIYLEHNHELLKAIDELPSAEPDTTTHDSIPAKTGENDGVGTTDDLISRQQAIVAIEQHKTAVLEGHKWDEGIEYGYATAHRHIVDIVEQLPSVQPERKTGHWIKTARWGRVYYCNQCRNYLDFDGVNAGRGSTNFCPNCGADMRGEQE